MPAGKAVIMSFWLRFSYTTWRAGDGIWHPQQMDRFPAVGMRAGGGAVGGEKLDLPRVVFGSGSARCWMGRCGAVFWRLCDVAVAAANWSGNDAVSPQCGTCEASAGGAEGERWFERGCDARLSFPEQRPQSGHRAFARCSSSHSGSMELD